MIVGMLKTVDEGEYFDLVGAEAMRVDNAGVAVGIFDEYSVQILAPFIFDVGVLAFDVGVGFQIIMQTILGIIIFTRFY